MTGTVVICIQIEITLGNPLFNAMKARGNLLHSYLDRKYFELLGVCGSTVSKSLSLADNNVNKLYEALMLKGIIFFIHSWGRQGRTHSLSTVLK
jgi:hypothetical protein